MVREKASGAIFARLKGVEEAALVVATPALAALSVAAWRWSAWVAAALAALALLQTVRLARRHLRAARLASKIYDGVAPASFSAALEVIEATITQIGPRLANRHPVTGLPTRENLLQTIDDHIASGAGPALLGTLRLKDYDRVAAFDQVAAEHTLDALVGRLSNGLGQGRLLAQVDRDCVAIWFGGDPHAGFRELRALSYVASQDLQIGEDVLSLSLEVGAAVYPEDGDDGVRLLLRAMAALPAADVFAADEGRWRRASSIVTAREQFTLEQDLAQAIDADQLSLEYQPFVDVARGEVVGAEALLRWDHPALGRISPARFIPIVEAIGLSERYGLWVLNTACRQAAIWQAHGVDLRVAVNLSALQLQDPDLRTKIERALAAHGLGAQSLELELTETAAMADADRTFELFTALRAIGVSLSIDDFGSGYSSLSYLKNLPFNKLKIDREFVSEVNARPGSQAICGALVALCRGLGLTVLAEGVETQREVETLRNLGCHVFQGFFYSKPLAADELLARLRDQTWPLLRQPSSITTRRIETA